MAAAGCVVSQRLLVIRSVLLRISLLLACPPCATVCGRIEQVPRRSVRLCGLGLRLALLVRQLWWVRNKALLARLRRRFPASALRLDLWVMHLELWSAPLLELLPMVLLTCRERCLQRMLQL